VLRKNKSPTQTIFPKACREKERTASGKDDKKETPGREAFGGISPQEELRGVLAGRVVRPSRGTWDLGRGHDGCFSKEGVTPPKRDLLGWQRVGEERCVVLKKGKNDSCPSW